MLPWKIENNLRKLNLSILPPDDLEIRTVALAG